MGADAYTARRQGDIRASFKREPLQELSTAQQLKIMAQTKCNTPAVPKGRDDIHRPAKVSAQLLVKPVVLEQPPSRVFKQPSVDHVRADASIGRRQDEIKTGFTRKPSVQPKAASRLNAMTQTKCHAPGLPKEHDIHRPARPLVQSAVAQLQNIKTQRSVNPPRVPKGLDDRPRTLALHTVDSQSSGHGTRMPSVQPTAAQRLDAMTQIKCDAPEVPKGHDIHSPVRPLVQSATAQQQNIKTQKSVNPPRVTKGLDDRPRTLTMHTVDPQPYGHGTSKPSVQPTAAQPLLDTITQIRSDDPEVPKGHDIHRLSRPSMQSVVAQQRNIKTRNWNPPPLPKGVNDRPSTMAMQRVDPQPFGHRMERGLASAQERMLAVEALLPNHQQPTVAALAKEDLLGSGPAQHVWHSSSDHKQARKEDRKYRKLCETWKCLPIQIQIEHDVDIGDQKWLFDCSIKQSTANPTNSYKATDAPLQCQSSDHPIALQPRSVYRQDLQMYQLPYVVPF